LREERLYRLEHPKFQLENFLFDKQLAFVKDIAPFKTAVCSRRAGKTIACAADLVYHAITYPGTPQLYCTLARTTAKKIIWPELRKLNEQFKLGCKINESELTLTFPNKSTIYVSGAKDKTEVDKFRGMPVKKVYIDEGQSFKTEIIEYLIDSVLGAALIDHAGTIALIGTPSAVPVGFFHDAAKKPELALNWSRHHWTYWDNPFIPIKSGMSHQEGLQRELTRRGVSTDDPTIQREWFGRWILDSESLLIHYTEVKNHYDALPSLNWTYILGIDLGFDDADALALLAWSEQTAETYLVEEIVTPRQGITELVAAIEALGKRFSIAKMVIDEGGLGKKIAEEIRRRHHIPVHPADKTRKMENVAFLNDALRRGHFKAKKNSRFAQDSYLLEIDRDKTTPDKIRVKDSFHSDIIDAVLYGFKESPAFTYQPPIIKPKYGTPEWAKNEVTTMEEKAEEYFHALEEAEKGYGQW